MSSRRVRDEDEYYYREDFYYGQNERDARPEYEEFEDDADYSYDYEARHEQWLEDEGELRRRRRRQKREAELRRKKRTAILAVVIIAALAIVLIVLRNLSGNVSNNTTETADTTETANTTETADADADTAENIGNDSAIPTDSANVDPANTDPAADAADTALYSYVETASTIDLGSSLTDISIYDAQRHITSGSSSSSDSGAAYGDSDGSDAASGETDTSSGETDTAAAMAADDYIDSQYVILVNIDTGEIVAERNAFDQIIPASMTKVMTLLVAVEAMDDPETALTDTFTMTQEICDESYLSGSSFVGYGVGDVATVEDMLYGTILPSGADAAMGLAEYTAGSQEAFVALMNEKCEELGIAATTHFSNVIGLYDDGANYSTPYDMCVILNAAIENDLCREVLSTRTWTTQAIMDNPDGTTISNWFLRRAEDHIDDWAILCGKTGYVNESGNCAVSYYQSASTGANYIACTALTYSSWRCIYDHAAIYNTYAE